jgi:mannitol-1-phosphate 5-dehydrogenase
LTLYTTKDTKFNPLCSFVSFVVTFFRIKTLITFHRTFVGFGFGAIQAGLFLKEAFESGNFTRLVVAEVMPEMVVAVRANDGRFWLNTAHADRIEQTQIGPIEMADPAAEADQKMLIEAVAEAEEIATAVPSIKFYTSERPGSIHRLLAAGLRQKARRGGPRAVIYAAENHNHAAEALQAAVMGEIPTEEQAAVLAQVRFLNTVIGKMSAVVSEPEQIDEQDLAAITPGMHITSGMQRAFRVEAFNHILISAIHFDQPFAPRGITVFTEKPDLLPFEEAKLYGHNATHALAAYVGALCGAKFIADLKAMPGMLDFLRRAFIEESGAALIRKHTGVDDLFTPAGYTAYADDLLKRMVNPFLLDDVERVGRDPERKLGWDDRLIGTIRVALQQGIQPRRYAFGAAAALARLEPAILEQDIPPARLLDPIWQATSPNPGEYQAVLATIGPACEALRRGKANGFSEALL